MKRIRKPDESKALGPLFHGPAEITRVTPTTAEVVFLCSDIMAIRSVQHLKPYYEADPPTPREKYTGLKRGQLAGTEDEQQVLEQVEEGADEVVQPSPEDEQQDVEQVEEGADEVEQPSPEYENQEPDIGPDEDEV